MCTYSYVLTSYVILLGTLGRSCEHRGIQGIGCVRGPNVPNGDYCKLFTTVKAAVYCLAYYLWDENDEKYNCSIF